MRKLRQYYSMCGVQVKNFCIDRLLKDFSLLTQSDVHFGLVVS